MQDYDQYTANEFIQDPFFIEWIYESTPASVSFWNKWVLSRPTNLEEFLEAEQALRMLAAIFGREVLDKDSGLVLSR